MPIREFRCPTCRCVKEVIHPSLYPETVPQPECLKCQKSMELMISLPRIDTSATFKAFDKPYRGPDGRYWTINNLRDLRNVEHEYTKTGHNVRFDAYSAEPSNPDPVDGFGAEYRTGEADEQPTSKTVDLGSKS